MTSALGDLYRRQLQDVLHATSFRGAGVPSWFGKPVYAPPSASLRRASEQAVKSVRLASLQACLYRNFYCQGAASSPPAPQADADESRMVERLSAANRGQGYWEDGWRLDDRPNGLVPVSRAGTRLAVTPEECDLAAAAAPGGTVRVRFPKEYRAVWPGFYLAMGDAGLPLQREEPLVRVYWNLDAEGRVLLMREATRWLNERGAAFQLKVHTQPTAGRVDAAVLYLERELYLAVRAALQAWHEKLRLHLRARTPALTLPIAFGASLAEDPGSGLSFGEHRCQLLARALCEAQEQRRTSLAARLEVVEATLTASGISIDAPYRAARSADLPPLCEVAADRAGSTRTARRRRANAQDVVARVAASLCREALWHEDRCTWIGASTEHRDGREHGTLEADLYAGAAGVGLFLAEYAVAHDDARAERTARGAVRYALGRSAQAPPDRRLGLFSGCVGTAVAALRAGRLLRDQSLVTEAHALARRLVDDPGLSPQTDWIGGRAGTIVGLLALDAALDDARLRDGAVRFGRELLQAAEREPDAWSWRSVNARHERNLTGLSHGTAGIGLCFLELFRRTRAPVWRRAAEGAFAYERRLFVDGKGWPDLREVRRGRVVNPAVPFLAFWCHGAAGIALSRLRAWEVLGDVSWKQEALSGLAMTAGATEAALDGVSPGLSVCHGLAGNAGILALGREAFGEELRLDDRIESRLAACLEAADLAALPPGFMLGLAGIAHVVLRAARPSIPSPLLLRPEAFGGGAPARRSREAASEARRLLRMGA